MRVAKHEKVGDVACALVETVRDGNVVAREHIAATDDGVYRYTANGARIEPPVRFLKLPPRKGDTWKVEANVGGITVKGTFVAGAEEVKVPAGSYKTVTARSEDTQIGDMKLNVTYYFAPGVGVVKQTGRFGDREVVLELERFDSPK